jgi:hypothetical protein
MKIKRIFYFVFMLLNIGCLDNSKKQTSLNYHSDKTELYKRVYIPDTSSLECKYYLSYLKTRQFYFKNLIAKIDSNSAGGAIIITGRFFLAACNLPNELKLYSDSVLISGEVFNPIGDERLRGKPCVLSEVRTKE